MKSRVHQNPLMHILPFEKVSIEEIKAALQAQALELSPQGSVPDWRRHRRTQGPEDEEVTLTTLAWAATLENEVCTDALVSHYPRIANRIAELWPDPVACERYLNELLFDRRGSRQGFPRRTVTDIAAIKSYLITCVAPAQFDIWGERIRMPK